MRIAVPLQQWSHGIRTFLVLSSSQLHDVHHYVGECSMLRVLRCISYTRSITVRVKMGQAS